jgi:hypothetical protein
MYDAETAASCIMESNPTYENEIIPLAPEYIRSNDGGSFSYFKITKAQTVHSDKIALAV